ncbi:MAG: glycoside hydrolase family 3 N-terminal domain-containing protein [Niabella sp.]
MSKIVLTLLTVILSAGFVHAQLDKRVNNLLQKMTLEEKAGQMTQLDVDYILKRDSNGNVIPDAIDLQKLNEAVATFGVGSILNTGSVAQSVEGWRKRIATIQMAAAKARLKIPVIYGIDVIHGNNYTLNSVLFPQPVAQAATFDPQLVQRITEVAAYETRASFIPWTFSPAMDVGRNPVWPRIWESFGEDLLLNSIMAVASVKGFEGSGTIIDKYHLASCLKHYIGYGVPLNGHDRTQALIPERELREYYLPSFAAAVKAGARSVMINSAEVNGVPGHANKYYITDILKGELKFDGFVVSDWKDIKAMDTRQRTVKNDKEATMIAINAGIDMSMVPDDFSFTKDVVALVKEGKISMSRIDDAVRRILKVKFELGLFENSVGSAKDFPDFNGKKHNQLNYDVAAEALTLLKNNDHILPLQKEAKILITGPAANTMRSLNGGWSRNWQGTNSDETESAHNTILEAFKKTFTNVTYLPGVDFEKEIDIPAAVKAAQQSDVVMLCMGEDAYAETPGNIDDLELSAPQLELAMALQATGKPMVYVLTEGRPRIISKIEPFAKAILQSYLPGNAGGDVIADAIAGKINPSGKLPYTYPRHAHTFHNYYRKYADNRPKGDQGYDQTGYNPQWEFGTGLSYTDFKYSNLKISSTQLSETGSIQVRVDVTNIGSRWGKETVIMYVSDLYASITPETKRMRAFDKISLDPGQTKTVKFTINKNMLSFIDANYKRVTEPGDFEIQIQDLKSKFSI